MAYQLFYDEKKIAEQVLEKGFTNGFIKSEAAAVAKYYRHVLGYGDAKVKKNLISFCKEKDPFFNEVRSRKQIKNIVSRSKYDFSIAETVFITKKEIETIQSIKSFRFQKILLAMLALAKKNNKTYINTKRWSDVKRIISKTISNKDISECANYGCSKGLLYAGDDFHSFLFIDNESKPIFTIKDEKGLINLIKMYENTIEKEFKYCILCGTRFIRKGKRHNLCEKHTEEKRKENGRKRFRKHYSKKSNAF